jgi:hypothetical protein
METYKPTPEDFKKAEDMLTPEQAEMTKGKEELMENENELKEEIELIKVINNEHIIVKSKNIDDIIQYLNQGYSSGFEGQKILTEIGIDYAIIRSKKMFEINENRKLLYLSSGLENWRESVKNYFFNRGNKNYVLSSFIPREFQPEWYDEDNIEEQLERYINNGYSENGHQIPKELGSIDWHFYRILKKIKTIGFQTDILETAHKKLLETAGKLIQFKSAGREYPEDLIPKDKSVRKVNPLVEPFIAELKELEATGETKLPDWLAEQGKMAGYSAYLQDLHIYFKEYTEILEEQKKVYAKFVKENNIENAPPFINVAFIKSFATKLEIINAKIHRNEN